MKKALIFAAGIYDSQMPDKFFDGLVIAADAGLKKCTEAGFSPDYMIGDFDSLGFLPTGRNVITLPTEKDETDLEAAVKLCKSKGVEEIFIYGALGGRLDHSLGNISLLAGLSQDNIKAFLFGENAVMTAVSDGNIEIHGNKGDTVSVLSWSSASYGVTLRGFKYPLTDYKLKNTVTLGVSNILEENHATVCVKSGTLLVIKHSIDS